MGETLAAQGPPEGLVGLWGRHIPMGQTGADNAV